jgi:hypothetical protein
MLTHPMQHKKLINGCKVFIRSHPLKILPGADMFLRHTTVGRKQVRSRRFIAVPLTALKRRLQT